MKTVACVSTRSKTLVTSIMQQLINTTPTVYIILDSNFKTIYTRFNGLNPFLHLAKLNKRYNNQNILYLYFQDDLINYLNYMYQHFFQFKFYCVN